VKAYEVNFDGLVGPTHNYAGLSYGNLASTKHAERVSNPKAAVRQGLIKMKQLADLGVRQAVLPPQERPDICTLKRLGFRGSPPAIIQCANRETPRLLQACCSASSMWAANVATVSPSADAADGRVHFTPANLSSMFHRAIEHPTTARVLRAIFSDEQHFVHHPVLPAGGIFSDEGAANHTRLCRDYGDPGVELFVFGRYAMTCDKLQPLKYPARQTFEASSAIARLHRLDPEKVVFAKQNPAVIDAGVFHNDVIAVGNGNVLFYHAQAFLDTGAVVDEIQTKMAPVDMCFIALQQAQVSVDEAVACYLFNSQLVTLPDHSMALIAPTECKGNASVKHCLKEILAAQNPISQVHYINLRESMKNGGGPACLRLRVVLTEEEIARTKATVFLDTNLYQRLQAWIDRHYRDRLMTEDLADPALLSECRTALDELTGILDLGSIYPFQRDV
jgi:succinylarginine dihydrolase